MGPKDRRRWRVAGATLALLGTAVAAAKPTLDNLTDLSLEELSNIEITSVSKRGERLSDAPTSVFVITGEDIRRSGATSLPEALRLAPNLQVARGNANGWAISARGFNSASANKLLVLIDGRSVYSPLFSGVFWDVQDLMLEDVERIEVISGPGGTLWGVNAVDGVVNVITRSSADTRERLLVAGAGNSEAQLGIRQGGSVADGSFRVYAKANQRRHTETADGSFVDDASHTTQVHGRSICADVSTRALVCSSTVTRGSWRSFQASWLVPESTANTCAAPRWSNTSVKPPVELPMSIATAPAGSSEKWSSAWASFTPPRLTHG